MRYQKVSESDLIEYRWLNMDVRCRTTEEALLQYARDFPGGVHRAEPTTPFTNGPVLMAYGRSAYSHEDMKALDTRLPVRVDAVLQNDAQQRER